MLSLARRNHGVSTVPSLIADMDRMMGEVVPMVRRPIARIGDVWPRMDVRELGEEVLVTVEVPGMAQEDLEVTFEDGVLAIRGKMESEEKREGEVFTHVERRTGAFQRRLKIGVPIDVENVDATVANGLLAVRLPKAAEAKPRKIKIRH